SAIWSDRTSADLVDEELMETKIARELGMERREPEIAGAPEHGHTVELGEHFDAAADALDDGRTDEHPGKVAVGEPAHRQRRLERLALAAVAVAAHRDVEDTERRLVGATIDHLGRAQDQARAGRECRQAVAQAE